MLVHAKSVYRIIAAHVTLVLLGLGSPVWGAHASVGTQGAKIQGPELQGTGNDGNGLRGPRLIGVLARAADGASSALLEIQSFRGDVVIAVVHDVDRGTQERVELPPDALVGMEWTEELCLHRGACQRILYRIAAVAQDPSRNTMPAHADNSDIWLYQVQFTTALDPVAEDWQAVCPQGEAHERAGIFVDGQWDDRGHWTPHGYTFSCAAGVIAKCAQSWGYKPWKRLAGKNGESVSLQPLHLACTRAARADYCGDGISHTRAGTLIDIFDQHGLNVLEGLPGLVAEAAFNPRPASWVERPRHATGSIAQLAAWLRDGMDITVSINVSARHLQEPTFVDELDELLGRHGAATARHLVLEVLATAALADIDYTCELMQRCRALGVRFALDDFGTGYSTFTYLKRLPLDLLKIDRSFVHHMLEDHQDLAIVEGVIALSRTFGCDVVAEGIETPAQAARLIALGCCVGQGNGIAAAMPAERLPGWVSAFRGLPTASA